MQLPILILNILHSPLYQKIELLVADWVLHQEKRIPEVEATAVSKITFLLLIQLIQKTLFLLLITR